MFVVNLMSLVVYFLLLLFSRRLMKLSIMPHPGFAQWSHMDSNGLYLCILVRLQNILLLRLLPTDTLITTYKIVVSFALQFANLLFQVLYRYEFNQIYANINLLTSTLVLLILQLGLVPSIVSHADLKEGIMLLVIFAFQLYGVWQLRRQRENKLIKKFKLGKRPLKHNELEQLMLKMIIVTKELIEDIDRGIIEDQKFAIILELMSNHQVKCNQIDCICNEADRFVEVFKQGNKAALLMSNEEYEVIEELMNDDVFHCTYFNSLGQMLKNLNVQKDQYELKQTRTVNLKKSQNNEDVVEEQLLLKFDMVKAKKVFILSFMKMFFEELVKKNPESLSMKDMYSYFTLILMRKPHLTMIKLKNESTKSRKGRGYFVQISQRVNELYIISQYLDLNEREKQRKSQLNFQKIDCEYFIGIANLYHDFHQQISQLSQNTLCFWKGFTVGSDLNPITQADLGTKMSHDIQLIYNKFMQIENHLIQKDPKIYMWFAQVQQKLINDQGGYQIFLGKMKEILQMKQLVVNVGKDKNFDQDSGIILVEATVDKQGQIIAMNKHLKRWLKRQEDEEKFLNIKCMMPILVEKEHDNFYANYEKTQKTEVLDRKFVHFVKDKDTAIIPCQMFVTFHYSPRFKYCYVGLANPIERMQPFDDDICYKCDQLIFMSIDWDRGQIFETSESFLNLLKNEKNHSITCMQDLAFQEKVVLLDDILVDFNFKKMKKTNNEYQRNHKSVYEAIHGLDFFVFNDELDINKPFNTINHRFIEVKIAIYKESYMRGLVEMGYVVMHVVQNAYETNQVTLHDFQQIGKEDSHALMLEDIERDQKDNASSSNGSQSQSSQSSFANVKNFHSFYQQATPRILKIVVQMVLILFLSSFIISTVNLGLNIKNQRQTDFEIRTVKAAYERLNVSVRNRVLMRVLLNIANGYESNNSTLIADRFKEYKKIQELRIQELKEIQEYLDNSGFPLSPKFQEMHNAPAIRLTYLYDNNRLVQENVTMKTAQNLLLARYTQINQYTREQLKGNLYIQTLTPVKDKNYRLTEEEEIIYFTVINSNTVIREHNLLFMNQYVEETTANANVRFLQAQILTIISIVTILVVSTVISPIISKIEERKFNALRFFLAIPQEQIQEFINKCEECMRMEEELENNGRKRRMKDERNETEREDVRSFENTVLKYSMVEDFSMIDVEDINLNESGQHSTARQESGLYNSLMLNESNRNLIENTYHNFRMQRKKKEEQLKDQQSNHDRKSSIDKRSEQSRDVPNYLRQREPQEKKIETTSEEECQKVQNQIKKIAFRQKIKTLFLILIFTLSFSVYFVATFLMADAFYKSGAQSIIDLTAVFNKESCFEYLVIYIRESQIRNETIYTPESGDIPAALYQLERCFRRELEYLNLRKNLPPYLEDARDIIEIIDSPDFCSLQPDKVKSAQCKTMLNGLLLKGLSNALQFSYRAAQGAIMDFESALEQGRRDLPYLNSVLKEPDAIEIIDAKVYIVNDIIANLKEACLQSAFDYFEKLKNDMVIIYSIFLLLLVTAIVLFFLLAFKQFRRTMWNTNLILKIIPMESLSKDNVEKIKSFFVS